MSDGLSLRDKRCCLIPNFFDLSPLHTAPLERETEKSTFTIDIPLRWSGRVEKQDELC